MESKLLPQKIHPDLLHWLHIVPCFLDILIFFLTTLTGFKQTWTTKHLLGKTFIREGQHLKTLFTLTILTKEERTSTRKILEHLLDGQIFYPISARPPFIKEIIGHNPITDKNIPADSLCLLQWNFPKRFRSISLHVHSQYTFKNKEKRAPNTLIRITTNGTILTLITDLSSFLTVLRKTKVTLPTVSI